METPCLFQLNPSDNKMQTSNFSPNQLINLSSSSSFSKNKFSNIKFFTTATSNKSDNFFLSHKKRRDFESTFLNNHSSTTSETKTFKLNLLNHDILYSYKQNQMSNMPTDKGNDCLIKTINSINSCSFGDAFPSSVKKNLMTKLDENHHYLSLVSSNKKKKTKNKVMFTTIGPEEDLEKLVDYILASTKNYTKVKKSDLQLIKNDKNIIKEPDVNANVIGNDIVNSKEKIGKSCKCKKVGCSKYLCNCLKNGLKCNKSCNCNNCSNN